MISLDPRLFGTWELVTKEEPRICQIRADATMTYVVEVDGQPLVLDLIYRIDHGAIVTTQANAPNEIRSIYRMPDPDTLVLEHSGEVFTFRRVGFREMVH